MSKKSKPPIALYSALSDTTRCRILEILKTAPAPVHVLTEAFSISRPAISRHLRVLKSAGLVAEVKKGRENVYAFRPAKLDAAKAWLETIGNAQAPEVAAVEEPVAAPKPPRPAKKKLVVVAKPTEQGSDPIPATAPKTPSINQMGFDF